MARFTVSSLRTFITLLFAAATFAQDDTKLASAVDDLLANRNVKQARAALEGSNDRAAVVDALKQALDTDGLVQGKINMLETLSKLSPKTVRAALDSKSKSSRRAAAWLMHRDPSLADQVKKVVIVWIKDGKADRRALAALIVGSLKIKECVPALEAAIGGTPTTEAEAAFASEALAALAKVKPDGLAERALAIAEDENQHWRLRGEAFAVIESLEGAPVARVRSLLLEVVEDRGGHNFLRNKAVFALRARKFASPELHAKLEEVLLREGDNHILQRSCLYTLGETASLAQLRRLLLDRRVYNHPYFGIRVDVATALAAMRVREKIALEILCNYMEDKDAQDRDLLVAQEAWLSFFVLTGKAIGTTEQDLFGRQPPPLKDENTIRDYLFRPSFRRKGVNREMVWAVQRITTLRVDKDAKPRPRRIRNAERLKQTAAKCRARIDELLAAERKR